MNAKTGHILIVDDDPDVLTAAQLLLKRHFALVQTEGNPDQLPTLLEHENWDVLLLDMNFALGANSGREGMHWLQQVQEIQPSVQIIMMTAYGAVDTAVNAMKQGAVDFILKPWHNERLMTTVKSALQLKQSREEVQFLRKREKEIQPATIPTGVLGDSSSMLNIRSIIERVAPTDVNVLILGENGTGKEVIAREIFNQSARRDEVMVTVDLGSVPETLFESELFGHKKGAFTGADQDRIGRFQAASGGTLFLDEIANIPLHLQSKLLTALEQRQVIPVGTNTSVKCDVRLICATNKQIKTMVNEGSFREDLYYRINTVEIHLPPLRERQQDIAMLLSHFARLYADKYRMTVPEITEATVEQASHYQWPGNVRELRHAVERALIMSTGDSLEAEHLLLNRTETISTSGASIYTEELNLDALEKLAIEQALKKHVGNISHAAKELGITRTSLYRRMEKYGL